MSETMPTLNYLPLYTRDLACASIRPWRTLIPIAARLADRSGVRRRSLPGVDGVPHDSASGAIRRRVPVKVVTSSTHGHRRYRMGTDFAFQSASPPHLRTS